MQHSVHVQWAAQQVQSPSEQQWQQPLIQKKQAVLHNRKGVVHPGDVVKVLPNLNDNLSSNQLNVAATSFTISCNT